jgi:hypothetical protein
MNPELTETTASQIESAQDKARQIAGTAQEYVGDSICRAGDYIRKNPWLAVGGAVLAGVVVAALIPHRARQQDRLQVVRDWLEDAREKVGDQLPSKSDLQSAVQSIHPQAALKELGKKLHLW